MYFVVILLFSSYTFLCSYITESSAHLPKKAIVNGTPANSIPYQVSIQWLQYHICGGVIVSKKIVLTAAHCMFEKNRKQFKVRAGTNIREKGGQLRVIKDFEKHPLFVFDNGSDYDIAILLLKKSLNYNSNRVQPVILPEYSETPVSGVRAIISGWGVLHENSDILSKKLMFATVTAVNQATCKTYSDSFKNLLLCSLSNKDGVDGCNADSGGPLVYQGKLIGIISSGIGCGRKNEASFYVNVPYFRLWIDEMIYILKTRNKVIYNANL